MATTKAQNHVARLKAALSRLNELTGGMRCQDADAALSDAWVEACLLERDVGATAAPQAVA